MPRRSAQASIAKRIGGRIRLLRQQAGLTQEGLAWDCNLAKPFLSQIEAGKRLPSIGALVAIAKRIGVEPADLLVLDAKNPRIQLLDAARRGDAADVARALRALGFDLERQQGGLLRVAEHEHRPRKSLKR